MRKLFLILGCLTVSQLAQSQQYPITTYHPQQEHIKVNLGNVTPRAVKIHKSLGRVVVCQYTSVLTSQNSHGRIPSVNRGESDAAVFSFQQSSKAHINLSQQKGCNAVEPEYPQADTIKPNSKALDRIVFNAAEIRALDGWLKKQTLAIKAENDKLLRLQKPEQPDNLQPDSQQTLDSHPNSIERMMNLKQQAAGKQPVEFFNDQSNAPLPGVERRRINNRIERRKYRRQGPR